MKLGSLIAAKWIFLTLALFLSLVTMYSLKNFERFVVKHPQLLVDPQFQQAEDFWQHKGAQEVHFDDGQLRIVNNAGASQSVWQNVIIETPAYIRFQYSGIASEVTPGEEHWARASGGIIYRDKEGARLGSKLVGTFEESTEEISHQHTERLRAHLGGVDITFRLLRSGGEFIVTDPVLSVLEELPSYKATKLIIVVFWIAAFIALLVIGLRTLSFFQIVVVTGLVLLVLLGALMPTHVMTVVNQQVAALLPQSQLADARVFLGRVFNIDHVNGPAGEVSKIGHLLAFAVLGFFAGWVHRKMGALFAIASLAVFALLTEALQLLVGGRTPSLSDFVIDISGAILGMVIGITCLLIYDAIHSLWRQSNDNTEPDPLKPAGPTDEDN